MRRDLAHVNQRFNEATKFTERVLTAALIILKDCHLLDARSSLYYKFSIRYDENN